MEMADIKQFRYRKLLAGTISFLIFYIIFFLYMRLIIEDNLSLMLFVHSLMFIVYVLSLYRIKWGLFLFVFLIPLLNFSTIPFIRRPRQIILFLFFGLFLGFLINNTSKLLSRQSLRFSTGIIFESRITKAMLIFIMILFASCLITIFRYSNLHPFITNNYYDLAINVNGVGSTGSMIWTIRCFYNYFVGFLFFVLIFNVIKSVSDIINAIISLLAATMVSAGVILYQYYFNPYFGNVEHWVNSGRYNATFTDPNALGAFTILMFPIFIGLLIYFRRWYLRVLILASFLLFLMELFFSGSRSAFIGIVLAVLIFVVIFIRMGLSHIKKRWKIYTRRLRTLIILVPVIILICLMIFSLYLAYTPDSFILKTSLVERTIETFKTGIYYTKELGIIEGLKSISNYRYIFWGQAVAMFKDYPLTGVGQGSYLLQLPNYLTMNRTGYLDNGRLVVDYTGNYYLQVLSELGLPGLILILFIFYLLANRIFNYFRSRKRLKIFEKSDWLLVALLISFISMLVGQIFGPHTNFDEVQFTLWLVIGLMIAYVKVKQVNMKKQFKPLQVCERIGFGLREKVSLSVVIIIFISSMTLSSATSLSINVGQNLYDIKGNYKGWENSYGFYKEETIEDETFRWTGIDASEVVEKKGDKMIIPIKDAVPAESQKPLAVNIFVNNRLVEKTRLRHNEWTDVTIVIPDSAKGYFTLTLAFSRSWVPKELGITPDARELGARVGEYRFAE
jgi:O-antigen ligase